MTATVAEYWDVELDSTWYPLHTYARQVTSLGGSRTSPPSMRGENTAVAYVAGRHHNAKTPDQRVLTLGGWISDVDDNGDAYSGGSTGGFNENWRMLQRLLWRDDGSQFSLRRRWYDKSGTLLTATALAEYGSDLGLSSQLPYSSKFTVDLVLPDPYFYGDQVTTNLALDTATVVTNDGDVTVTKVAGTFTGQLSNPTITNATPDPNNWMKIGTALAAGDSIDWDGSAMTAVRDSDSANLIGAVSRSGARQWLVLQRGDNTLTLTADSGSGSASIVWQPAYL